MKKPVKKPAAKKAPVKKMSGGGAKPAKKQSGGKSDWDRRTGISNMFEYTGRLGPNKTKAKIQEFIYNTPEGKQGVYRKATPMSQIPGRSYFEKEESFINMNNRDRMRRAESKRRGLPSDAPEQEALAQQELVRQRKNYIAKQQAAATVNDIKSGKVDYKKYLPKKKKGGTSKTRKK